MARQHAHKFTIADDDAVRTLVNKLLSVDPQQKVRPEKLLRALDDAARQKDSNQKCGRRSSMDC